MSDNTPRGLEGPERLDASLETTTRIATDGGTTWEDLSAFQRDVLTSIVRLEDSDHPSYGIGIKRELETQYGEVTRGQLYPNLNELVDLGLLEKTELDQRTNEYRITESGRSLPENRTLHLANTCGMDVRQPVTDGGEC